MIQSRLKASAHRLVSHFGGGSQVTLWRMHTLKNANNGSHVSTLLVDSTTALGASSIDLSGTGLEGTLVASTTFTVAGDATTYTVTSDVTASNATLTSVAFSPALTQEATEDAVVTISESVSYTASAVAISPREQDMASSLIEENNKILWVSAEDLEVEPRHTDEIEWDGAREAVVLLRNKNTTGTPSGYRFVVGSK